MMPKPAHAQNSLEYGLLFAVPNQSIGAKGIPMTKKIAAVIGIGLVLLGLIGFVVPDLLGMHLSPGHNLIHLISGGLTIFFAVKATPAASKAFCLFCGLLYAVLGSVGLMVGGIDQLITVLPNQVALGFADHVAHLVVAAAFCLAALHREATPFQRRPFGIVLS
jgi:hypothetical protein